MFILFSFNIPVKQHFEILFEEKGNKNMRKKT